MKGLGQCRRLATLGLIGLAMSGLPACHEHVALQIPRADATPQERERAYERLRPLSMHETHITTLQGGVPVGSVRRTDYLQLANGTRVYYPEDLLAVIDPQSPSGIAATRSVEARSTANILNGVAIGGMVVGFGIMLVPVMSHSDGSDLNTTPLYVGTSVILGSLLTYFVAMPFRAIENDEAATAFETYDPALRDSLRLNATAPTKP